MNLCFLIAFAKNVFIASIKKINRPRRAYAHFGAEVSVVAGATGPGTAPTGTAGVAAASEAAGAGEDTAGAAAGAGAAFSSNLLQAARATAEVRARIVITDFMIFPLM